MTLRLVAALCLCMAALAHAQPAFLGYSSLTAPSQQALERRFQAMVSPNSLSSLHRPLARRPHPSGTAGSREVIAYLERTLRGFGFTVERHEYRAWLSRPRSVRVTMTAPGARTLSLREPPMAQDPTSSHPELGEGYIAYSASGDVTGDVVYANYGLPADYAELARLGVSVAGRVVLARYGRSHRAVKVFTAQEAGATAVILYSDPADDGLRRGPTWPDGFWRGADMLQRGNAKLSWFFHGDPLTPGVAATAEAPRLDRSTAPTLPRIPVVAISGKQAQHLLSALGGVAAPSWFEGGVPGVKWHLGPGPAAVRVAVEMDDGLRPIVNVVATLAGRGRPERIVMLGGHHDAWTFGGVDPGTGTAALLEVGRVLGRMARTGWRPQRTIQLAFWDAEEYGLVGSTEHAEHFRERLKESLLLYVNTDMYMRGRFDPGGVPSLRDFVVDVAKGVPAGEDGRPMGGAVTAASVFDSWAADTSRPRSNGLPELKALGSGADFVPFQDFLGVPVLSIEFIGANAYGFGTYHSNYDSRAYVERVADPGFRQGVTMARTLGTLALRMANADILPYRFGHYGDKLRVAIAGAEEAVRAQRLDTSVGALREDVDRVRQVALQLEATIDRRLLGGEIPAMTTADLNDRLARIEQLLTDDAGPADRAWYRHVFHGWNIYSLYDGQLFPGLHDAIRRSDRGRVDVEVQRIEAALLRMHGALDAALGVLTTEGR